MKSLVPFKQYPVKLMLMVTLLASSVLTQAQSNPQELVFHNSSLYSGTAGADSAVYRFPLVTSDLDALVKINGRSSSIVTLADIDYNGSGFDKAFQPRIKYDYGNGYSSGSWWMEFKITFVNKGTTTPATITTFKATALDIDGDDDNLHEWDAFYAPTSYTLEANSQLQVSNLLQMILGILQPVGKTFDGVTTQYNGIDTTQTSIMTTVKYDNVNSLKIRLGCATTHSSNNDVREYSVWFKNFSYVAPVTLPVKLVSFTATLNNNNNKADLKWTTASEMNVSHFVIERSTDGINYDDAGVVFAYGNATDETNYSFSDNLNSIQSGVVYYRLRSVDNDGKSQYSATRIIRIGKQGENTISILTYPNPVSNELRISIPNNWQNKKVTYEVFNANGQTSKKTESSSSSQTETVDMSHLSPGFYIVRVSCEGQTAEQKIVKQ